MKKVIMLTLLGLCLHTSGVKAADTTEITGVPPDTAKRVETAVRIQQPPMMFQRSNDSAGGGIYFGFGGYHQSLEKLNSALTKNGFNMLDENMKLFSCGFFGLANPRSRFGLDYEYFWSKPASAFGDSSAFGSMNAHGFQIGMKGGYDIISLPKWGIMPIYGIAYYSHTYDFKPRYSNLEEILNKNSKDAIQLRYSGVSLTAGLNVHIRTKFDKDIKENGKLHQPMAGLNLEGGIHYYPQRNISVGNGTIDDGPQVSRFSVYGKLYLNMGEKVTPLPHKDKD